MPSFLDSSALKWSDKFTQKCSWNFVFWTYTPITSVKRITNINRWTNDSSKNKKFKPQIKKMQHFGWWNANEWFLLNPIHFRNSRNNQQNKRIQKYWLVDFTSVFILFHQFYVRFFLVHSWLIDSLSLSLSGLPSYLLYVCVLVVKLFFISLFIFTQHQNRKSCCCHLFFSFRSSFFSVSKTLMKRPTDDFVCKEEKSSGINCMRAYAFDILFLLCRTVLCKRFVTLKSHGLWFILI